jgi:hypothetical protein
MPSPIDRELSAASEHDAGWIFTTEKATPLYIGPLPHYTRRMLQALDGYWAHCEGGNGQRHHNFRASLAEDWWTRFEKYRALVERQL